MRKLVVREAVAAAVRYAHRVNLPDNRIRCWAGAAAVLHIARGAVDPVGQERVPEAI